VNGIEQRYF